jgi:hypothetical protein
MRKHHSLRALARLFTSIAVTSVTLGTLLSPVSAAEDIATMNLDPKKCTCHPGYPCICPRIAADGTAANVMISRKQLQSLKLQSLKPDK